MSPSPREEYESRRIARRADADRLERRAAQLADLRLLAFLSGLALAGLAWWTGGRVPLAWCTIPVAVFAGLVIASDATRRRLGPAHRRVAYYDAGLDRIDDRWPGRGESGLAFATEDHPYDLDLDLFGPGSLYERLCTAQTPSGRATLAGWLLAPARVDEIRRRQAAVDELRGRLDLREDLSILGDQVRDGLDRRSLVSWGEAPERPYPAWWAWGLALLSAANIAGLTAWSMGWGQHWFLLAAIVSGVFTYLTKGRVRASLEGINEKADELTVLAGLLRRLEQEPFQSPWLVELRHGMESSGICPSRRIGRLAFLTRLLDAPRNQLFLPIALLLFWTQQIARLIESWRDRSGRDIAGWLDAVGRFEAILSLASYAYEVPGDPFPELVEGAPLFEARALGHPLLPASRCVRNDVGIGGPDHPRVLMISGSNMSGKSTLLRSVGTNVVLALAGAPVRADSIRLTPLAIGATLRVQDSLQAGKSRFYAEIVRLRQCVDLARGPIPLLFLLDEVLHGTNSHDRRAGAQAIVAGLARQGAIGLVTTHDLALAEIVEKLGVGASNFHFEDHLEDGRMTFDYRMRPGVVAKSNALELMRAVGLDV